MEKIVKFSPIYVFIVVCRNPILCSCASLVSIIYFFFTSPLYDDGGRVYQVSLWQCHSIFSFFPTLISSIILSVFDYGEALQNFRCFNLIVSNNVRNFLEF